MADCDEPESTLAGPHAERNYFIALLPPSKAAPVETSSLEMSGRSEDCREVELPAGPDDKLRRVTDSALIRLLRRERLLEQIVGDRLVVIADRRVLVSLPHARLEAARACLIQCWPCSEDVHRIGSSSSSELTTTHRSPPLAFAFDPDRRAILLVAGDKSGGSKTLFTSSSLLVQIGVSTFTWRR